MDKAEPMTTMNISLPESLRRFVDERAATGFGSASEYIRTLLREDQKRSAQEHLEQLLLKGINSGPAEPWTQDEWTELRQHIRATAAKKLHGTQTASPQCSTTAVPAPTFETSPQRTAAFHALEHRARTQRVTLKDLDAGRIRIPAASTAKTKDLFPPKKSNFEIALRGIRLPVAWDPRLGPDRERSGVLRVGAALKKLVAAEQVLAVTIGDDGTLHID